MTTALMLVERGFQDEEYVYAYYRMREEGWSVLVWAPDGKPVRGNYGVPALVNTSAFTADAISADVIVIPGGFESPDRLREREDVQGMVRRQHEEGKLIAAICHGPWVLISAGICSGRRMTGYKSIAPDIRNAGATYVDGPVVVDGNIITAQHYRDNGAFMRAVVNRAGAKIQYTEGPHAVF